MSNTKLKNKLIKNFTKTVKDYGFVKKENFPWFIETTKEGSNILIFTFDKNDNHQFKFLTRVNLIEDIWEKYFFDVNPRQQNPPYTLNSKWSNIPKYFPEFDPIEPIQIDFTNKDLIADFDIQVNGLLGDKLIPFFKKANEVDYLNTLINKPIDNFIEVIDFFVGGNDILFKKLIISKLVKSDQVDEIFDFALNTYKKEIEAEYKIDHAELKIEILNKILNENFSEDEV